jgi:hypothetical protein
VIRDGVVEALVRLSETRLILLSPRIPRRHPGDACARAW